MHLLSRRFLAAVIAFGLAVPAALAGALPHPVVMDPHRPSYFQDITRDTAFRAAVRATVRANHAVGSRAWEGAMIVGAVLASDIRAFWNFLCARLTFSPRLADNPFFVAHKEAAIVGSRTDEPFLLDWAIPEELRAPDAWRAAVANLPPSSVRGTRSIPEHGVSFIGWPRRAANIAPGTAREEDGGAPAMALPSKF